MYGPVVPLADAGPNPRAVVVKLQDAVVTEFAVFAPGRAVDVARDTVAERLFVDVALQREGRRGKVGRTAKQNAGIAVAVVRDSSVCWL